ncbi:Uncharacterised protein [Mycobacteroides abscessus subsp. massiliense]|nr:Uncharacterised protein [Mycobacteroides abscessus subsp. massiliense]
MPAVARPFGDLIDNLQMNGVEVDVRVGAGVVDRRRNLVVLQGKHDLREAGGAGRGLQMSEVRLRRAQQRGLVGVAATADHTPEPIGLDRVTEDGAGAVRLDDIDIAGVDSSVLVGLAQHLGLGIRVGGEQPVGTSVVVDGRTRDDRHDRVTVAARVRETLQHEHAAALGPAVPVGILRERLDPAVGGQHAADLVEADRHHRRDECVDATGHHDIGLTGAQGLHPLMHGDQRRGTCRVDGDARATEVIEVRNPVRDNRTRVTGDGVRMGDGGIGHRQVAVVVVGATDVHTDALTLETGCRNTGVFQCLPSQFQRHPLLRIHVVGFHLGQREELGVESLDVLEISTSGGGLSHTLGNARLGGEFFPPALGQIGDGVAALQQRLPQLRRAVDVAGQTRRQADHRDIEFARGDLRVARPVLVAGIRHLGLTLDDAGGQGLDGGVLKGNGGREGDPREVLDVGGHRDSVA